MRNRLGRNALAVERHANDQEKGVENFNPPNHEAADSPQQAKRHWNNADQSEFPDQSHKPSFIHRAAMANHINT